MPTIFMSRVIPSGSPAGTRLIHLCHVEGSDGFGHDQAALERDIAARPSTASRKVMLNFETTIGQPALTRGPHDPNFAKGLDAGCKVLDRARECDPLNSYALYAFPNNPNVYLPEHIEQQVDYPTQCAGPIMARSGWLCPSLYLPGLQNQHGYYIRNVLNTCARSRRNNYAVRGTLEIVPAISNLCYHAPYMLQMMTPEFFRGHCLEVKQQAAAVECPLSGVKLWQGLIDSGPGMYYVDIGIQPDSTDAGILALQRASRIEFPRLFGDKYGDRAYMRGWLMDRHAQDLRTMNEVFN